ncbi:hypothetical protein SGPA1_31434 [Streptomyces misionensis JCM 4497]
MGRAGRRHRHRVDRHLHQARGRRQAPGRRRQEGPHLGSGQGRGHHHRDGRQPGQVRPGEPPRHLQRVVHHQLCGPDGEGSGRELRHRQGSDDHGARVHQRPAHPGLPAQGPAPRPRRRREHHPDHHRCRQGHRPGPAAAQGQAGRPRHARPGPDRLRHRPRRRTQPRGHQGRGQRRLPEGLRGRAEGSPRLHRGPDRLLGHRQRPGVLHLRLLPDHGPGGQEREGHRLVRQRVGLLQPPRGPHGLRRQPALIAEDHSSTTVT